MRENIRAHLRATEMDLYNWPDDALDDVGRAVVNAVLDRPLEASKPNPLDGTRLWDNS